jgi:CheY-like chemotaxis protein
VSREFPEVILLDVDMPKLTGPQMAYRLLIEDCGREYIPIILLSAIDQLHSVAKTVGTPYFLSKPYSLDDLTKVLNRTLKERRPPRPSLLEADQNKRNAA